ncbi:MULTISPECIES: IclR family transcriptional regulator [Rhodomicrobium]|uniref:IclR family transcriptional regulator n=1 Tax=Rhodomicrobium TaxID=1068 RepID=UPI000B4B0A9B|nr:MULTISPECIES: IclR family transcriptional regulator [Rhodomicrobium]
MNTSQSLERGLMVLELLDASPTALGVREMARRLEISTTIVQRLVNTLTEFHYLEQVAETRRYRIGPRALGLGSSLLRHDKLISSANAELQVLANEHGLSGFLCGVRGASAVYLLAVQSSGPIAITAIPGEAAYLHSTAMGKALLAGMSDEAVNKLLGKEALLKLTPRTIVSLPALIESLQEVRRLGYATSLEENLPGVISIGAPVRNADGEVVAGLSVAFAGSAATAPDLRAPARLVLDAASRLSRGLGCPQSLLPQPDRQFNAA